MLVSSRRWLPGLTLALVLLVLGAFVAAQPALPQTQPAPGLNLACAPDANGNAVFTLTSSASPGTTVSGTYSITSGGPANWRSHSPGRVACLPLARPDRA
ncbi:MAG: hypothetical protein JOZ87_32980 [Chloroflexi bacterium]|nr:hypothetical protein [Chloroflexota bacterium]